MLESLKKQFEIENKKAVELENMAEKELKKHEIAKLYEEAQKPGSILDRTQIYVDYTVVKYQIYKKALKQWRKVAKIHKQIEELRA